MMIAKVLSDAGWRPPDSIKQATVARLQQSPSRVASGPRRDGESSHNLTDSLLESLPDAGTDEFAIHSQLGSLLTAFPDEVAANILRSMVGNAVAEMDLALAGFALHRDSILANAALATLASISGRNVDSRLVERLVRMRPWLPETRLAALDAAVRALRPRTSPPVARPTGELRKVHITAFDGVGAQNIIMAIRNGATSTTPAPYSSSPRASLTCWL